MTLNFEFAEPLLAPCVICNGAHKIGRPFKIVENNSLPPAYRTLYTFKCAICLECIGQGREYLTDEIKKCMDEYMGGCDEMLRSCGLQPCSTGS